MTTTTALERASSTLERASSSVGKYVNADSPAKAYDKIDDLIKYLKRGFPQTSSGLMGKAGGAASYGVKVMFSSFENGSKAVRLGKLGSVLLSPYELINALKKLKRMKDIYQGEADMGSISYSAIGAAAHTVSAIGFAMPAIALFVPGAGVASLAIPIAAMATAFGADLWEKIATGEIDMTVKGDQKLFSYTHTGHVGEAMFAGTLDPFRKFDEEVLGVKAKKSVKQDKLDETPEAFKGILA